MDNNPKETRISILILERTEVTARKSSEIREEYYVMSKTSILHKNIAILNMYVANK